MANRYWVGGTETWNATAGTKWALTSGGVGGQTVPTSSDDVFFDENSGGIITQSGSSGGYGFAHNIDMTNFTGVFSNVTGKCFFTGSLTLPVSRTTGFACEFYGQTGSVIIASNGSTLDELEIGANSPFTGGVNITLADDLVCITSLSFYSASSTNTNKITFNANNKNVTCYGFYYNTPQTEEIIMGSGTWTISTYGWNISTSSGLTLTPNTSTIKFTVPPYTTNPPFMGGGFTYNNVWFSCGTNTGYIRIYGSNTFANFKDDGTAAHTIKFTDGTIQTIASLTINGSAGKLITLTGTSSGGWTISDTTGINTLTYCNISYSTASGGATWKAILDTNINGGNNTGWTFYDPFTNPANIYASDNTYATLAAISGILTVEISKDAGANWSIPQTVTFGGSDTLETVGAGAIELFGLSFTRADMVDANFRVRFTHNGYRQVYKTFGFTTDTDILTGIEIAIEGKYASSTISLDLLEVKIHYGTSILPVQAGSQAFASDGRKAGEGAGSGTGLLVYYDGSDWIASDTGVPVAA